jgi:ankyrin repeat protein
MIVSLLNKTGIDIDIQDEGGRTPLHYAVIDVSKEVKNYSQIEVTQLRLHFNFKNPEFVSIYGES